MNDIIGNKGQSEHVHYEAPDSLHSTSYARVLDLVSEGEILGLTNGLQSVLLDGTPVENADGSRNFTGVTVDFRAGTQTQDYIPGFPSVENEVGVGVELKYGTPWVHAISNTALSAIRIILGVPALSKSDTTNGDIKGYKIDYRIELSTDGGAYAVVLSSSFNGKTTTAYQRSARIDLPRATTGWSIRVSRLTANANTAAIADMTTVVSYTDVIDAKLRYPMSAIVGVQVDAKQFPNVPSRAYDLMGRIIQVPSNYNAKTRVYTGNWDGTFKPSWSDNPAWVFRDIALNDRYGLGHRITAAQLDKWSLYAIARYCDGMVPDGKGGTEPRFTCNVYLQTQKQAYAVLQDLASVFRGISYWGAGSIIASADMPTDAVYVYTAANVIGGKFSRVGSSKKTRYTTALVSWNDPADLYKAKVEYVEDPEGIKRYGIQQVSLTAFGCASQGQAHRVGLWALATSRLETEMITFDVGMDGAIALPGQIVRIADPSRMGRRNGGRIKTASGRVVVLDKAPVVNAGDKLTVILPSGKSETRVVASIAGDSVTVTADWSTLPIAQSVWSVDSTSLIAPMYKIRSVVPKDAITYTITATQHEPGKFDYVENGTAITPRPQTALNSGVQQPPASVTVVAYTVSLQDVQKLGFTATCAAVDGAVAYEGAFQADNGNWFTMPRQPGPVFDVLDVLAGNYIVKIAAVNSVGVTSIETVSAVTLVSKNANPKNAGILLSLSSPGFNVNADGSITPASITVHADLLDLEGEVSFSAVGGSIASSGRNATIYATNMPGAAATVTASISALGQTFTKSIDIVKSADGAAGADKYYWIKYGTSAAGAGLTDNPDGMTYMGIAVNKSSPIESTVAADYTWSKIAGSNGADGASTFMGVIYKQQAGQPATPTGGSYNFATTTLTPPAGWLAVRPASSTTPTWAAPYLFTVGTIGATVTAGTWGTPVNAAQNGADGIAGPQNFTVLLYKYGTAEPAAPTGFSTFNWVTLANGSYSGSDGWAVVPPANPGTPGLQLWIAAKGVTAAAGVTSTANISYSTATISAYVANGANGANGAPGAQSRDIKVFQWAATIPAAPSGTGALSWATGLFGGAPANWSLAPGAAVPGYTQWSATVRVIDTAAATSTPFSWSTASIGAETYAGGDGLSYVTAYVATTVGTASAAPAPTTGKTSVPAANSSGLPGTPQSTVPALTAGQYLMQFDGSYNKATDQVTWSIPYVSSLKVGSLSAQSTNTGALTVTGDITSANGLFKVDANGVLTSRAGQFVAADGTVLFSTGVGLTLAGAPAETLNSNIVVAGRNIIQDSAFERGIRPWTTKSSAVAAVDIRGDIGSRYLFIQSISTASADNDAYVNGDGTPIPVTPGKTYVIAFDYATAQSSSITGSSCYLYGAAITLPLPVLDTAANRVRSSILWTCPAGVTTVLPRFGIHTTGYAWLAVYNFMIAEGNKDIGWTPAPEDALIQMAATKVVANAAKAMAEAQAADGVLDRGEKSILKGKWADLEAEFARLNTPAVQGAAYAEWEAYVNARGAVATFLNAIGPGGTGGWQNTDVDSPIDRGAYIAVFSTYADKKMALQNAVDAKNAASAAAASALADGAPIVSNLNTNSLPSSIGRYVAGVSGIAAADWEIVYDPASYWTPRNKGAVFVHAFGTPTAGSIIDMYDEANDNARRIDVTPGYKYEFSVALSVHRCIGSMRAVFYKADGTYIGESANVEAEVRAEGANSAATPGENFPRVLVFAVAPADAAKVMMVVRLRASGGQNCYVFASEWYVGRASQTQTIGTKYTDFSVTGVNASLAANKAAADEAVARVRAEANDALLSRSEKPNALAAWRDIEGERPVLVLQAQNVSVSFTAYDAAKQALSDYLGSLGSSGTDWWNTAFDTTIVRDTYMTKWTAYYTAKESLQAAISAKLASNAAAAALTAAWPTVSGRPADADILNSNVKSNVNLLEGLNAWIPTAGNPWLFVDSSGPGNSAIDSFHRVFPANVASVVQSRYLNLAPNWYTLSFRATADTAGMTISWDLYPDSLPQLDQTLTPGLASYQFTFQITAGMAADAANCIARFIRYSQAGQAVVFDVKLEVGKVKTGWSSNVITAQNAAQFVGVNALNATMIGGDIASTNYSPTTGWLMQRSGNLYASNAFLRGSLYGGNFTEAYAWSANGGDGYHISASGALWGSNGPNGTGRSFQITSSGDLYAPGMTLINKQLTLTSPILITPRINTTFAITIPNINANAQVNTSNWVSFGTVTPAISNGVGPFRYSWVLSMENGSINNNIRLVGDPTSGSIQIQAKGSNIYVSGYLSLTVTDSNQATAGTGGSINIQFGSGVPV